MTYEIRRFYADQRPYKVIKTGVSLEEAQEHCQDPDTAVAGEYFDGYQSNEYKPED